MGVPFGVFTPQGWRMDLVEIADPVEQWEAMTTVAKAADAGPWDSIWLYDHFHPVPQPPQPTTVFECWTTTAALARDTQRVNIGQMVGCNGYRNPALYAKMASTVDVASRGRLYAGIGAGWYEQEWRAYGYQWPELRDRMGSFREGVEIIYKMWTEDAPVFSGKYHSINMPINLPKGVRKPHPMLWIGGGGEQVTLKLVAKFADACNIGFGQPDQVRHKLDVLHRHCDALGRDFDEIVKSTTITAFPLEKGADPEKATAKARGRKSTAEFLKSGIVAPSEEIGDHIQTLLDAGANYIINYIPGVAYDHEPLHRYAEEIIPRFN
jgi:F420-dependent oxidoreductase-like protein